LLTFEKTDQTVTARSTVQPKSQRIVGWVTAGLEEPEEDMEVGCNVDVTGVRLYTGSGLADALFAWLLVGDGDIGGGLRLVRT